MKSRLALGSVALAGSSFILLCFYLALWGCSAAPTNLATGSGANPLHPGDVLDLTVTNLFAEGLDTVLRRKIDAEGFIEMPLLEQKVKAAGASRESLGASISKLYGGRAVEVEERVLRVVPLFPATRPNARSWREFRVTGPNVTRPGVYSLDPGHRVTLKMILATAGITELNCGEVAVRIVTHNGTKEQESTMPNVNGILSGKAPEIVLDSQDQVYIGVDFRAAPLKIPTTRPADVG
jgi:protein involved in polysaccharide export with SLBB domain